MLLLLLISLHGASTHSRMKAITATTENAIVNDCGQQLTGLITVALGSCMHDYTLWGNQTFDYTLR